MNRLYRRYAMLGALGLMFGLPLVSTGSSHREAPLISYDPLADNTDLYAFRSPDDTNTVTIIANYIPFELPEGGPNYSSFGEGIRYEIHIKNSAAGTGDDITYRFLFNKVNEDPTTFFNIRLGKQNLQTNYRCYRSIAGGPFDEIVTAGVVPPPNIGPRSIESPVGLGASSYQALWESKITTATTGETVFCGPVDDPFFVDLGGIFDLGQTRSKTGVGADRARDGVAGFNCHTIALKIPIATLQKDHKTVDQAANILDGDFVIGVWASASRPKVTTLSDSGAAPEYSADYVQVSRLGMPLTNEAVIPIGMKDRWNATNPSNDVQYASYFKNPELALYMDDSLYGGAVPALAPLRIQHRSLGAFDFGNGKAGLYGLPESARAGTALSDAVFGPVLLPDSTSPRAADILPIFYTGVPNLAPYQLATGKNGNPLAAGKPFINNFLPTLGDMLRLNMATPITPRTSPQFSSEGIINTAVLGLTDPAYNTTTNLQFIPNMDGFPNGRRLEDDVTRIELQAVGGIALAAIGLWYDDYQAGGPNPVTPMLVNVLSYSAGPDSNDLPFRAQWPYMALPHRGYDYTKRLTTSAVRDDDGGSALGMAAPSGRFTRVYPNPSASSAHFDYHTAMPGTVSLTVFDANGRAVATVVQEQVGRGDHAADWTIDPTLPAGSYVAQLTFNGAAVATTRVNIMR